MNLEEAKANEAAAKAALLAADQEWLERVGPIVGRYVVQTEEEIEELRRLAEASNSAFARWAIAASILFKAR